ncbi:MAG: thiamine phosphate synthase [Deltaproteobacteria bacterium]
MESSRIKGLYAIIDTGVVSGGLLYGAAARMLESGVKILQLRAKDTGPAEMLEIAERLRAMTTDFNALFIVNDRVDVAMLSQADGVHLGQGDIPIADARGLLGGDKIIGVSTHDALEAKEAEQAGAAYVSFGPIFQTGTKKDAMTPRGIPALREIRETVACPVVAIGGIRESNMTEVLNTGVSSIAMISELLLAGDIPAKISSVNLKLRQAHKG